MRHLHLCGLHLLFILKETLWWRKKFNWWSFEQGNSQSSSTPKVNWRGRQLIQRDFICMFAALSSNKITDFLRHQSAHSRQLSAESPPNTACCFGAFIWNPRIFETQLSQPRSFYMQNELYTEGKRYKINDLAPLCRVLVTLRPSLVGHGAGTRLEQKIRMWL